MILLTVPLLFTACTEETKTAEHTHNYTCPMHPQIIKDEPGSCPICGMDLVPVTTGSKTNELMLSESQIQLANVSTMAISPQNFNTSKVLNARLIANPELSEVISSRYAGRIEKLFVKEAGRPVSQGQPIFQIYSEELQTLQQDYLLQVRQAEAFPDEKIYSTLRESAKNKLRLYGYSASQIENLRKTNKVSPYITVSSRASGIVNEISVTEGQYVSEGSPILRLENFTQLWVEADVYPSEAGTVKEGTAVQVSVSGFPELKQTVRIDFISPQIDPATQLLKIRAPIKNPGPLQPGMQATVLLPSARVNDAVALPIDAVIRDEDGAHVWIKTGANTFAPRIVNTGQEDDNQIVITSGLEDVKEVVVTGSYLLTSEYILKKGKEVEGL